MSRYIDADKVMEEIHRIGGHNLCEWDTLGVKALICRQDTADVVEVVRCENCVYCRPYTDGKLYCHKKADIFVPIVKADDYCSYGERREEEILEGG